MTTNKSDLSGAIDAEPIPFAKRVPIADVTRAVDVKMKADLDAESARQNEFLLARATYAIEAVMAVERQKHGAGANLSLFGTYTVKAIEGLLEALFANEHIVVLPPFMAAAQGAGFAAEKSGEAP